MPSAKLEKTVSLNLDIILDEGDFNICFCSTIGIGKCRILFIYKNILFIYKNAFSYICEDKSTNSYVCPIKTRACEDLYHNIYSWKNVDAL